MPEKYISESDSVSQGAEVFAAEREEPSEFDDIRNFGTIMEYMDFKDKTFWERIGPGGTITANPTVHDDMIYFGAYDKNFYAVSLEGKELWRFRTKGVIQAHGLCIGGRVYFGSKDRNFYCADAKTGMLVWKKELNGPISNGAAEHNGVIYVSSEEGSLYALDADSGKTIWTFNTSYKITTPLVVDDRIYCGYYSKCLYCLNMNGELLWKFNTGGLVSAWPAAHDGNTIYFGSWDKNLYAIAKDGRLKWKYAARGEVLCPVAEKGRVYFSSADSNTHCLDSGGNKIWEFKTEEPVSEIAIDGNTLYMGCYDSNLYAVDKNTGVPVWKFKTGGIVHCRPLVHMNRAIFGSWDCNLYCLDKKTGRLLWRFPTSLGTPSVIEPPEQLKVKVLRFVASAGADKKQDDKYKAGFSGSYDVDVTTYASAMNKTYVSGRKSSYIK